MREEYLNATAALESAETLAARDDEPDLASMDPEGASIRIYTLLGIYRDKMPHECVEAFQDLAAKIGRDDEPEREGAVEWAREALIQACRDLGYLTGRKGNDPYPIYVLPHFNRPPVDAYNKALSDLRDEEAAEREQRGLEMQR